MFNLRYIIIMNRKIYKIRPLWMYRFFPEGLVLMLTTADEPASCVGLLRTRQVRNPSIMIGHYRLSGDKVNLSMQKQENIYFQKLRYRKNNNIPEQIFRLVSYLNRMWTHYYYNFWYIRHKKNATYHWMICIPTTEPWKIYSVWPKCLPFRVDTMLRFCCRLDLNQTWQVFVVWGLFDL